MPKPTGTGSGSGGLKIHKYHDKGIHRDYMGLVIRNHSSSYHVGYTP